MTTASLSENFVAFLSVKVGELLCDSLAMHALLPYVGRRTCYDSLACFDLSEVWFSTSKNEVFLERTVNWFLLPDSGANFSWSEAEKDWLQVVTSCLYWGHDCWEIECFSWTSQWDIKTGHTSATFCNPILEWQFHFIWQDATNGPIYSGVHVTKPDCLSSRSQGSNSHWDWRVIYKVSLHTLSKLLLAPSPL